MLINLKIPKSSIGIRRLKPDEIITIEATRIGKKQSEALCVRSPSSIASHHSLHIETSYFTMESISFSISIKQSYFFIFLFNNMDYFSNCCFQEFVEVYQAKS